ERQYDRSLRCGSHVTDDCVGERARLTGRADQHGRLEYTYDIAPLATGDTQPADERSRPRELALVGFGHFAVGDQQTAAVEKGHSLGDAVRGYTVQRHCAANLSRDAESRGAGAIDDHAFVARPALRDALRAQETRDRDRA